MNTTKLIGKRVQNINTHKIGTIRSIHDGKIEIDFHGIILTFAYPGAFSNILVLEDETLTDEILGEAQDADFKSFKRMYIECIHKEVSYLQTTGGKHYTAFNGSLLSNNRDYCVYAFDTDAELHFMDGTPLRMYKDNTIDILCSCSFL